MQNESIGKIRFGTALFVATTFKVMAVLSLLGGFRHADNEKLRAISIRAKVA